MMQRIQEVLSHNAKWSEGSYPMMQETRKGVLSHNAMRQGVLSHDAMGPEGRHNAEVKSYSMM